MAVSPKNLDLAFENRSIEPGETAEGSFTLTPRHEGEKTLTAKFTSRELEDVDGFVTLHVNLSNEL